MKELSIARSAIHQALYWLEHWSEASFGTLFADTASLRRLDDAKVHLNAADAEIGKIIHAIFG